MTWGRLASEIELIAVFIKIIYLFLFYFIIFIIIIQLTIEFVDWGYWIANEESPSSFYLYDCPLNICPITQI